MAITDVAEYAHLSDTDVEALAVELDAIGSRSRTRAARRTGPTSCGPSLRNAASTSPHGW
jgi:hypothetical protein